MTGIDNIRNQEHARYFTDGADMTAEVDLMRLGVLIRFEVDVNFEVSDLTRRVTVNCINSIWAAGVFDHGYEGADYRDGKPRCINVKVDINDLTQAEYDEIMASAASDIEYQLKRARD